MKANLDQVPPVPVERLDLLDVGQEPRNAPGLEQLQGEHLRQGRRVLDGTLHVQVDPLKESPRTGNEPDPDSGADDLGEAVEADDPALGVQGEETRGSRGHKL